MASFSNDDMLTIKELSAILRTHPTTLYRLVKRGDIPGFRIGSDWRFRRDLIERWMADKGNSSG
jgi:excisionase family DNA binding protein